MRKRVGLTGKFIGVLSLIVLLAVPNMALSAPPTPSFAPGFPLMAGPVVMVMWVPVPGAAGYNIYMNGKVIGKSLVAPPFQLPTPEDPGDYLFEITSVGPDGSESGKSRPGKISIVKLVPPKEINTLIGEKNVSFRWTNSPGTAIVDIYRSEDKDGKYALIDSVQDNRYSDTKVKTGKTYYYKLKSKDVSGKESSFSEMVVAALVVEKRTEKKVAELKVKKSRVTLITPSEPFIPNDFFVEGDRIFVLDRGGTGIKIYDLDGVFQSKIGGRGFLPGQFVVPQGMGRLSNGNITVSDLARKKVIVIARNGQLVKEWKMPVPPGGKEAKPGRLAVNSKDEIFVEDEENTVIQMFSADGASLGSFGAKQDENHKGPEFFVGFGFLAFAPDDTLFISDWRAGDVHVLDTGQKHKMKIGYPAGVGAFVQPGKMIFDAGKKEVLIPDALLATVQAFDMETGEYRYTLTNEDGEVHESKQRGVWKIGNPVGLQWGPGGEIIGINSVDRIIFKIEVLEK